MRRKGAAPETVVGEAGVGGVVRGAVADGELEPEVAFVEGGKFGGGESVQEVGVALAGAEFDVGGRGGLGVAAVGFDDGEVGVRFDGVGDGGEGHAGDRADAVGLVGLDANHVGAALAFEGGVGGRRGVLSWGAVAVEEDGHGFAGPDEGGGFEPRDDGAVGFVEVFANEKCAFLVVVVGWL